MALYDNHIERKTFPTTDEISEALESMTTHQQAVNIVSDALDELSDSRGKHRNLLNRILRLQVDNSTVRLLCTSRPAPEVDRIFLDAPKLEVKPTSEDIGRFVTSRLSHFKAPVNARLSAEVFEPVGKASHGMFLLARFLADKFESSHSIKQVKQLDSEDSESTASSKQPHDFYKGVYRKTLEKIELQGEADIELAMKVLRWLTHARRLLTVPDLRCALAIEPSDTELDEDKACSEELILVVCAGLVAIDPGTGIIRLVHQTVQVFFDGLAIVGTRSVHLKIATSCLTYLCFDRFKRKDIELASSTESDSAPFEMTPSWLVHRTWAAASYARSYDSVHTGDVLGIRLPGDGPEGEHEEELGLLDYAANHSHFHARHCPDQVCSLALRLLGNQQLAANAFIHATSLYQPWAFLQVARSGLSRATGLHLVAAIGMAGICKEMLCIFDKDNSFAPGMEAHLKADEVYPRGGFLHKDRLKKIHADAGDDGKWSPPMWAAHGGHDDVVRLLLSRNDVDTGRTCHRGDRPLHYASRQGWASIVDMLITHGADKWYHDAHRNAFGETAVVQAALQGHGDVVEVFKAHWKHSGLDSLDKEVSFGLWPIHIAAQRRPVSVIRSLVEQYKIDSDAMDPKGYNAVTVAADWHDLDVVQYFLREWDGRSGRRRNQVFKASATAAANRIRFRTLQLIIEEAGDVVLFRDAYGKSLVDVVIDAQNS